MKYDVFLSSKTEDNGITTQVFNFLISNGLKVFLASREFNRLGEKAYSEAINDILDNATDMIVVASSIDYINSKWVQFEWSTFNKGINHDRRKGKLIFLLDSSIQLKDLPATLNNKRGFTFDNYKGNILWNLLSHNVQRMRIAAEEGEPDAQFGLANYYADGIGVPQDYKKAVFWWRKAAEIGDEYAQFNLGICFEKGHDGVPQDYEQAIFWYKKAAERELADAQNKLILFFEEGKHVKQNYIQAAYWCRRLAELDDRYAQFKLGYYYERGLGVTQDYRKAFFWYSKAAEQGNTNAQFALGKCYEMGLGVLQDNKQAVFWYRKAVEQGNTNAQFALGKCYEMGLGVPQDYDHAMYLYREAARQGNEDAKKNLELLGYSW